MNLAERIRKVGEQVEDAAELLRQGFSDMERRMRRKMRVYPPHPQPHIGHEYGLGGLPGTREELAGYPHNLSRGTAIESPGDILEMMARSGDWEPESGYPSTHGSADGHSDALREETHRKPIISINGRDVEEPADREAA